VRLNRLPPHLRVASARHARSRLPASLFKTSGLPQPQRFAAWQESIGVIFEVQSARPDDFDAQLESYLIDDIMLARCSAGAQKFDRRAASIARDSLDHYMIQLFLDGSVDMTQRGRSFRANAGTVIGFDFTEVMDTFNSTFDLLSVVVPRRRLAPLLTRPEAVHGCVVDPNGGPAYLLSTYFQNLFLVAPTLTPPEASAAMQTLLNLIALAFNGASFATTDVPEAVHQAELLRVQQFIKEQLANAALGPDLVAVETGHSRARLYRLFAPVGGVAEYIKEQRLRRCLADLISTGHAHRQIAEIAYSWGFHDPAYFTKAFKQRFGHTPSEARHAAAPSAGRDRIDLDPRVGDRLYEAWLAGIA
jgi:AraC-like DNA-binding protein